MCRQSDDDALSLLIKKERGKSKLLEELIECNQIIIQLNILELLRRLD